MPRISPVPPPYAPSVAEDLAKLMPPGIPPLTLFTTVARNPRVLRRLRKGGLLDPGAITVRERELVILRTTALCRSEYEWGVHVTFFGAAAGFTPAQIAATVLGDDSPAGRAAHAAASWTARDQLLLTLCDSLHAHSTVDDALFAELRAAFDDAQLVELTALAGLYHMVSYMTHVAGLAPEAAAARFPR